VNRSRRYHSASVRIGRCVTEPSAGPRHFLTSGVGTPQIQSFPSLSCPQPVGTPVTRVDAAATPSLRHCALERVHILFLWCILSVNFQTSLDSISFNRHCSQSFIFTALIHNITKKPRSMLCFLLLAKSAATPALN